MAPDDELEESVAHEAAHADSSRGRSWLPGLVVVVIVAAVGVGGAVVGRVTAPKPQVVVTSGPVVEESPNAAPLPVGQPATGDEQASGQPQTLLVAASTAGAPAVLMSVGTDLPNTSGVAHGYHSVNAGISGAQVASILASTFGVFGSPTRSASSWTVGPSEGRLLIVEDDPLFTWRFTDTAASGKAAAGPPLTSERAIDLTSTLLAGIGVDTDSVDWQVDRYAGMTVVTAWQTLGRARTSLSWQIGFAPDGTLVRASGFSAGLDQVPDYPVVGARTAVQRTRLPGWNALVPRLVALGREQAPDAAPSSVPATSSAADSSAGPTSASPTVPTPTAATPAADTLSRPPLAVPVTTVVAQAADLGLAQYWQADGSLLILPTYLVTGTDGSQWTVLAIGDQYVEFVDTAATSAAP